MTSYTPTTLALFSDIHGGSPVGLMRPIQWQLQTVNVTVNPLQRLIWKQFDEATAEVGKIRKRRRLVAVFDGDATEGNHHGSKQTITQYTKEHEAIAIDAIDHGLKNMKFGKNDHFYMVAGTASHVEESEERIAADLKPVPFMPAPEDRVTRWCWPILPLEVNGVFGLIVHHGPGPGKGALEGNPLRNAVRNMIVGRKMRGKRLPRFVVFAHRHAKQHIVYEHEDIVVDAFILPSFQGKTDWLYSVDPFAINNIGMLSIDIDVDGSFGWRWLAMELTDYQERIESI